MLRTHQNVSKETCFTAIVNLYHLFYNHNIKEVLIDAKCKKYIDGIFTTVSKLKVDFNITEPIKPDYIKSSQIEPDNIYQFLYDSDLKPKYDLVVVHEVNLRKFLPLLHLGYFIFVYSAKNTSPVYLPYTKINDCFEGILYVNDLHSIVFPYVRLDIYQQTYIRDKPYRFLRKMQQLLKLTGCKTIVEIGSCRTAMTHDLSVVDPTCCNDSHSTFFWCETDCSVTSVDVNPMCESILQKAYHDKHLKINGKLDIVEEDGLRFLKEYEGKPIDFLFLDAWDVIPKSDYAEKHLEAYEFAKQHLDPTRCFIAIDDTDILNGGKGRLLIPKLIEEGWLMICKGRHTIFFKGDVDHLFSTH